MEVNSDNAAAGGGGGGGGGQAQNPFSKANPNPNPNARPPQTRRSKAKSCKGCAFYSSVRKSKSKNPFCVGVAGTPQQFPSNILGEAELDAYKRGARLENFKYACLGYSIYLDNKHSSADSQDKTPKLPFCMGIEMLIEKKPSTSPVGHVPAPAHKSEDHERATSPPRTSSPPHNMVPEYFNRTMRNASIVASGVARNLKRVGNYAKEALDDILNPYRRGPK